MGRGHQEDMMMEMGMGAGRHSGGRGGGLRQKEGIAAIAVVVGVYFAGKARAPRSTCSVIFIVLGKSTFCRISSATFAWWVLIFAFLIQYQYTIATSTSTSNVAEI